MASTLTAPNAYRKVAGIKGVTNLSRLVRDNKTSLHFNFNYKGSQFSVFLDTYADQSVKVRRFVIFNLSANGKEILFGPPNYFTGERIKRALNNDVKITNNDYDVYSKL